MYTVATLTARLLLCLRLLVNDLDDIDDARGPRLLVCQLEQRRRRDVRLIVRCILRPDPDAPILLALRPHKASVAMSAILVDLQRLLGGLDVDPVKLASLPEAHGAIRGNLQAGRTSAFVSPHGRQPTRNPAQHVPFDVRVAQARPPAAPHGSCRSAAPCGAHCAKMATAIVSTSSAATATAAATAITTTTTATSTTATATTTA